MVISFAVDGGQPLGVVSALPRSALSGRAAQRASSAEISESCPRYHTNLQANRRAGFSAHQPRLSGHFFPYNLLAVLIMSPKLCNRLTLVCHEVA
jgi:hypothetical protein